MGQTEDMQLASSQVMEIRGAEKKAIKKRCFACHDTSHNLEQCIKKYKHTTVSHQFGYATKYPFTMIRPSNETVQKEKFYHHCVLITSNLSNLDQGILKSKLLKFWKLSGDWELRRECNKSFLVSFSSEDDVLTCLKHPKIETLLDDKAVSFSVTRWNEESNYGSLDLDEEWILVSGVPRMYRNWTELYQVASAFGVLINVDEESLEVGDKEPIRLKIASKSFDGAPFSYYFRFGWSSKLVMLTAVQDKTEGMKHRNKELDKEHNKQELNKAKSILLEEVKKGIQESRSNREAKENKISAPAGQSSCHLSQKVSPPTATITESSKPQGVQSICPSPRIMIGEDYLRGIPKPPIKHVFERRNKKQLVSEAINKSTSNKMDKEVAAHSGNATRTGASTGRDMLEKDCSKMVPRRELNMEEITPVEESEKVEKLGARDTEDNNVAAPTIKSKKTSRTPRDKSITRHAKGVGMDGIASGIQVHQKEDTSKIDTMQLTNSEEVGIYKSFSEMGLQENLLKGIQQYGLGKPSVVHQRGIVPLCKGFGVIHQSLSETTETICTGVLQRLDYASAECQALILVPTAYLAQETEKVLGALGQFLGVTAQTCTGGGTSADADQQTLSSRVQVLIGTPDCILDRLQRHALSTDHIRMFFLDEADELLTGGSKNQINNIILHLPKKIQIGLFSATYSNEAMQTSRRFMDKQVAVIVPREEELKNVKQHYLEVEKEELKIGKLYALCKATEVERFVIFVNTRGKAVSLAKDFSKHYSTVSIRHGGMSQQARNKAIQKFNSAKSSSVLIATDNQGTNAIPQVLLINYDLPTEPMVYVRRLQQENRQFRKPQSVVINLVTPAERCTQLAPITRFCNSSIGQLPSNI